jgi:hypothetical protein
MGAQGTRWSGGFMTTMILLGVFCSAGLVPLIVGFTGQSDSAKKDQAKTLMIVGGIILALSLLWFLLSIISAASQPEPTF